MAFYNKLYCPKNTLHVLHIVSTQYEINLLIMKNILFIISFSIVAFSFSSCNNKANSLANQKIKVGVFDGHGGAQTCIWETVEACRIDNQMSVRTITTGDIANGVLDSLDAIIIPGGGGSRQYLNLGLENINRIKEFIQNGGGAVGICAGAYLFSNTPEYSCIKINGAQAIDIEHDNRGHGIAAFSLSDEGKKLFPEYSQIDTLYCMYYEGPVFIESKNDTIKFTEYAKMLSDVHEEGDAPSNMTNNRPFFIGNSYGKGRVFSSIAHPEATPGKMWMIPRMVRWCVAPLFATDDEWEFIVNKFENPEITQDHTIANREVLMSKDDLLQESKYFKTFLYGSYQEKIDALDWLEAHFSWDAKRWIQGLLFDQDPQVRARAAKYVANTHYLKYKSDLQAAYYSEKDSLAKASQRESIDYLNSIR